MRKIAYAVAHILSPNFQKGITIGEATRSIMGADHDEDIVAMRTQRIVQMFEEPD